MFRKHSRPTADYDKAGKIPVIKASICNGEKVAGFKDMATGKFDELMFIRTDDDLREFLYSYGVKEEEIRREW